MSHTVVRYRVKRDCVEENLELVRAVYRELEAADPAGFRYATFQLEDGVSFVHIASAEDGADSPLPGLSAFERFRVGLDQRCEEGPLVSRAMPVGSFSGSRLVG